MHPECLKMLEIYAIEKPPERAVLSFYGLFPTCIVQFSLLSYALDIHFFITVCPLVQETLPPSCFYCVSSGLAVRQGLRNHCRHQPRSSQQVPERLLPKSLLYEIPLLIMLVASRITSSYKVISSQMRQRRCICIRTVNRLNRREK